VAEKSWHSVASLGVGRSWDSVVAFQKNACCCVAAGATTAETSSLSDVVDRPFPQVAAAADFLAVGKFQQERMIGGCPCPWAAAVDSYSPCPAQFYRASPAYWPAENLQL